MSRVPRSLVSVGAFALILGVSACSGDSKPAASGTSSSSSGKGTVAGTATVVPGPKNDIVKRKTVTLNQCQATGAGAHAQGVITNPKDQDVAYKIQVTFTNEHATDLATVNVNVTAKAKTTTTWKADGKFATNPKVKCVLGAIS